MNSALASIGIFSYADVLSHLPRRYENYTYTEEKVSYEDKEHIVLKGKIRGGAPHPMRFAKRTLYRFYFETVGGMVFLIEAWNRTYLGKMLKPKYFIDLDTRYHIPQGYLVDEKQAEEFDKQFPFKEKLRLPGQLV